MEIEVLPGLKAIRRRPHMFLGELEREDLFDDLILEALCHAIDEAIERNCQHISITLKPTGAVFIHYDAGMPLDLQPKSGKPLADILLTELLACHNLKKHIEIGSKYCQYGLAALNALCSEFQVKTVCSGQCGEQIYFRGEAKQPFVISPSKDTDQTRFYFIIDEELLGNHVVHIEQIRAKMTELEQDFESQLRITCNVAPV
jgi:DNA gyrase/topoisomerase IV subunit B